MTRIYKEADRVVIWLGEDDGQAKTAFSRLEELSWAARRIMMQNNITQVGEVIGLERTGEVKQALRSALASVGYEEESWLTSINTLLVRPWWTRAWIRQEVIVAQFPELFCGRHSLPWIDFEHAMSLLLSSGWANANDLGKSEPLRTFESLVDPASLILQRERHRVWNDKRQTLLELVRANYSSCHDPRDHIFSLLGIVDTRDNFLQLRNDPGKLVPWHLRPDYSLSTREVFTKATKMSISDRWHIPTTLDVLASIQTEKKIPNLPSWVPDWSMPLKSDFMADIYSADGGIPLAKCPRPSIYEALASGDEYTLNLAGIYFDDVFHVGSSWEELAEGDPQGCFSQWMLNCATVFGLEERDEASGERRKRWVAQATQLSQCDSSLTFGPYGSFDIEERVKAMMRTVLMDKSVFLVTGYPEIFATFSEEDVPSENARKAGRLEMLMFNVLFRKMEIPEAFPSIIGTGETPRNVHFLLPFIDAVRTWAPGRRPIISNRGYPGLVPSTTLPGDKLVLLFGSIVPFVVRKASDHHKIIGPCYIDGTMYGEILKEFLNNPETSDCGIMMFK